MKVNHAFISPKSDAATAGIVKPSAWNADHVLASLADGIVIGRKAGEGAGTLEELPLAVTDNALDLSAMTGGITPPTGTTTQRPITPKNGETRWNSTTSRLEYWNGTAWLNVATGDTVFTGALQWSFLDSEPPGWMFFLGSFGSAGSPTNHPRDDSLALYGLCWGLSPAIFPMTDGGGRGVSMAVDWAAHRGINMPDWRERYFAMSGSMNGATPNNLIGLGSPGGFSGYQATIYTTGGEKQHVQTVAELVSHSHALNPPPSQSAGGTPTGSQTGSVGPLYSTPGTDATGGGGPFNVIPPTVMLNVFVKL